jgi:hypothetical protein
MMKMKKRHRRCDCRCLFLPDRFRRDRKVLKLDGAFAPKVLKMDKPCGLEGCGIVCGR